MVFETKVSELRRKAEQADWEAMLQYGGIGVDDSYWSDLEVIESWEQ